jgi:hypothetical protein
VRVDIGGIVVPDIADSTAPKPDVNMLRLSPEAIDGRLRRVFLPNVKGEHKVSTEIVEQWKSKKSKGTLRKLFQSCGFNTDWFGGKCCL